MQLAFILDTFGHWERAYKLAYSILKANPSNRLVNVRYVGLFLRPVRSNGLNISPEFVEPDTAFGIEGPGVENYFVIESDQSLRTTPNDIDENHPVAKTALGHRVGEIIAPNDREKWTIKWIKPKYLAALHRIMESFNVYFPTATELRRVLIPEKGTERFKEIFSQVRARHEVIAEVFDHYEQTNVPIAFVGETLGSPPLETFLTLIEAKRTIKVCGGTTKEQTNACTAISANQKRGCILDAITLHIVLRLDLIREMEEICGPVGIAPRSAA